MAKKVSSAQWLQRHVNDYYVKEAQSDGYHSRAAYKLLELDKKYRLLKAGMRVVDLGSAPGSWSQVAAEKVGEQGQVVGVDILPMASTHGVIFLKGSLYHDIIYKQLLEIVLPAKVDLVISDMAPNLTGVRSVDQARAAELNQLSLAVACRILKLAGSFLVKSFQGTDFCEFVKELRRHFAEVTIEKPRASRDSSREVYLLARKLVVPLAADDLPGELTSKKL